MIVQFFLDILIISLVAPCLSYTLYFFMQEGMLLNFWWRFLKGKGKKYLSFLTHMLGLCVFCMNVWVTIILWLAVHIMGFTLLPFTSNWVVFIGGLWSIGFSNILLTYIYNYFNGYD